MRGSGVPSGLEDLVKLREHLRARIIAALETVPAGERRDLYVISLRVYDQEEPRLPLRGTTPARAAR